MLHTVVFPFVPVTPIIVSGFSNIPKKSGHNCNAIFPGIYVAFLFNNFNVKDAHLAIKIAI